MIPVGLLLIGVGAMLWRPAGVGVWVGPTVAAVVLAATGHTSWSLLRETGDVLRDPLLFLTFAVPLAVLLDRLGFFAALAARLDGQRHLHLKLWLLAIAVVIIGNLDAAVVLLTPLYIRTARRHGLDPLALAYQPAAAACLASGVLPVSNLTNLLAAEALGLGVVDFATNLALPTVVAVAVAWWRYRSHFAADLAKAAVAPTEEPAASPAALDGSAIRRGVPVVAFVLLGFTIGDEAGVPAWVVAAVAVVVLVAMTRERPWRAVPVEAIALTAALAVLVAAAAPHLGLDRWLAPTGVTGDLRAFGLGAFGSLASNNLPATLAGTDAIAHPGQVWPLLIGLNMASLLVLTASLSNLLWRDTAAAQGLTVGFARFSRLGLAIGAPATAAALVVQQLAVALGID